MTREANEGGYELPKKLTKEDVHRIFGYSTAEELEQFLRNCPRHYIRSHFAEVYLGSADRAAEIRSNNDKYLSSKLVRAIRAAGIPVQMPAAKRGKSAPSNSPPETPLRQAAPPKVTGKQPGIQKPANMPAWPTKQTGVQYVLAARAGGDMSFWPTSNQAPANPGSLPSHASGPRLPHFPGPLDGAYAHYISFMLAQMSQQTAASQNPTQAAQQMLLGASLLTAQAASLTRNASLRDNLASHLHLAADLLRPTLGSMPQNSTPQHPASHSKSADYPSDIVQLGAAYQPPHRLDPLTGGSVEELRSHLRAEGVLRKPLGKVLECQTVEPRSRATAAQGARQQSEGSKDRVEVGVVEEEGSDTVTESDSFPQKRSVCGRKVRKCGSVTQEGSPAAGDSALRAAITDGSNGWGTDSVEEQAVFPRGRETPESWESIKALESNTDVRRSSRRRDHLKGKWSSTAMDLKRRKSEPILENGVGEADTRKDTPEGASPFLALLSAAQAAQDHCE